MGALAITFLKGAACGLILVLLWLGLAALAARLLPGDPHDVAGVGLFISTVTVIGGFMAVLFRSRIA